MSQLLLSSAVSCVVFVAVAVAVVRLPGLAAVCRRAIDAVTRTRVRLCGTVFVVSLAASCVADAVTPRTPVVDDEFAYLFAARTFAAGRLTNPTPPEPEHFEALHLLVEPTFQAKYPPGQAFCMAAGLLTTGEAVHATRVVMAAFAAATAWAAAVFVGRRFGLVAGLLPALGATLQILWANSYWGGQLAGLGGALVLGGLGEAFLKRRYVTAATAYAAGAVVLSLARPFEGACYLIIATAVVPFAGTGRPLRNVSPRILLAASASLGVIAAAGVALHLTYNAAVTGDPFRLPYALYSERYATTPAFVLFQGPRDAPRWDANPTAFAYWTHHADLAEERGGWIAMGLHKASTYATRVLPHVTDGWTAATILGLLALPCVLRRRRPRCVAAAAVTSPVANFPVIFLFAHYIAPSLAAFYILIACGLQQISGRGRRRGSTAVIAAAVVACGVSFGTNVVTPFTRIPGVDVWSELGEAKRETAAFFEAEPGRHLVLFRHVGSESVIYDWAYNDPDLSSAKVIWAREIGPVETRRLAAAFPDRELWLVTTRVADGVATPTISPYGERPSPRSRRRSPIGWRRPRETTASTRCSNSPPCGTPSRITGAPARHGAAPRRRAATSPGPDSADASPPTPAGPTRSTPSSPSSTTASKRRLLGAISS